METAGSYIIKYTAQDGAGNVAEKTINVTVVCDHKYTVENKDETNHWLECECGEINQDSVTPHDYTIENKDETNHWMACECGEINQDSVTPHDYTIENKDETNHWMACECGEIKSESVKAHTFNQWKVEEETHTPQCACGEEQVAEAHAIANWTEEDGEKTGVCKCDKVLATINTAISTAANLDLDIQVESGAAKLNESKTVAIDLSPIGKYSEVVSIKFGEIDLGVDPTAIAASAFGYAYGEQALTVVVKTVDNVEHTVTVPVLLISKVIKSAEDYANFGIISKACESEALIWGGYFQLGNDITITQINEFIDRSKVSLARNGTDGFKGTFDGCGYTIDGMTRAESTGSAGNAFLTAMHADGVLKNISFTNVTFSAGNGSFIVGGGGGLIENVYVQYKEISNGNSGGYGGTFYTSNGYVNNSFVDASKAVITGNGANFRLLGTIVSAGGVYCVYPAGYDSAQARAGGASALNENANAFASYIDLADNTATQEKIEKWNADFWTVKNGTPLPVKLWNSVYSKAPVLSEYPETVVQNDEFTFAVNYPLYTVALDEASLAAGVTLNGNTVSANMAAADTEITVTVSNVFDGTLTAEFTVTVEELVAADDPSRINLDIQVVDGVATISDKTFSMKIAESGTALGNLVGVSFGETALDAAKFTLENGVLTAPVSVFGFNVFGVADLVVSFDSGDPITMSDITVVSKVIMTVEDYANWIVIAKAAGYTDGGYQYWSGYFQLGANLSQNGGIALNEGITRDLVGSASGSAGGFVGTFDGCGYTIDGLTKNSDAKSGFIGIGAGGTLKNIALTNVVWNGTQGGLISFAGKGTYEDIYVSYASVSNATGTYVGTFDVGNSASTKTRIFIDASETVWDDASKSNFKLVGQGNFYGGLFGVDNRLTTDSYTTTSFSGTMGSGWAELIRFQSKAQMGMFATYYNNSASSYAKAINTWLTTCDSWTVVNGVPVFKSMVE